MSVVRLYRMLVHVMIPTRGRTISYQQLCVAKTLPNAMFGRSLKHDGLTRTKFDQSQSGGMSEHRAVAVRTPTFWLTGMRSTCAMGPLCFQHEFLPKQRRAVREDVSLVVHAL